MELNEQTQGVQNGIVAHVIDHAAKIASLQQGQQAADERVTRDLSQMREDVLATIEEAVKDAYERIAELESLVDDLTSADSDNAPAKAASAKKTPAKEPAPGKQQEQAPDVDVDTSKTAPPVRFVRRFGRKIARPA